jgi:hypothetical protein
MSRKAAKELNDRFKKQKGTNQTVKREPIRVVWVAIVLLLLIAVRSERAEAADSQLITSVALIHEYNDNLFLDAKNELSDNITTVAPKLEAIRHSERYTLRADGKLEFYRFEDYDEYDDVDQWYNGSLEAMPTERWRFGVDAHVSDDNRPDRDIEETGLVLNNVRRRRINAGTSANYTFSEMMIGGLSLEFNRENFDDPQTSDRKDYHATLSLTRSLDAWLARTTGRLHLGYSHYAFEREYDRTGTSGIFDITSWIRDDYELDNYSLTVGTQSALTEKLDLTVDLGGRYATSQKDDEVRRTYSPALITEDPLTSNDDYDSYGFVGNIDLGYNGERSRCNLLLSHDLQPVSGESNAVNRTTVRASGSLRLLERLRGNLYVQWYRNENDQNDTTQSSIDTQTWNLGGGLRWTLNDYFDLAVSYVYTFLDDRDDDTTAYRNKAMVTFEAHHDWLE